MRSVIQDFSTEGENKDGPTGVFSLNEGQAKALGSKVLETKKGLKGEELEEYLNSYWAKTWRHYDVNQGGSIPAGYVLMMVRFLANDNSLML